MKVLSLDGIESIWRMSEHKRGLVSEPYARAKKLIKEIFPTLQILEEVSIHIDKKTTLFLDFYLPLLKTAVEVHGQQHFEYNNHHYESKADFYNAKKRDFLKQEWLSLNNIKYIELVYNESEDEWTNKLCS